MCCSISRSYRIISEKQWLTEFEVHFRALHDMVKLKCPKNAWKSEPTHKKNHWVDISLPETKLSRDIFTKKSTAYFLLRLGTLMSMCNRMLRVSLSFNLVDDWKGETTWYIGAMCNKKSSLDLHSRKYCKGEMDVKSSLNQVKVNYRSDVQQKLVIWYSLSQIGIEKVRRTWKSSLYQTNVNYRGDVQQNLVCWYSLLSFVFIYIDGAALCIASSTSIAYQNHFT